MYSVGQLAKIIGVHRQTVWAWCRSGRIAAWRTPGGHYRVTAETLATLACAAKPRPAPSAPPG